MNAIFRELGPANPAQLDDAIIQTDDSITSAALCRMFRHAEFTINLSANTKRRKDEEKTICGCPSYFDNDNVTVSRPSAGSTLARVIAICSEVDSGFRRDGTFARVQHQ